MIQHLDPPFGQTPPVAGTVFTDRAGFTYEMLEAKPHTNRDGSASWLLTLKGVCSDCGKPFVFKQGPTRPSLPRRCPEDAKGKGREKTYPWGSAPVHMVAQHEESSVCRAFVNRFLEEKLDKTKAIDGIHRVLVEKIFIEYLEERFPGIFDEDDAEAEEPDLTA